ncbi:MAG: hypothetical protein GX076_07940 [Clostridiales bacterium]|nr:hypothetical protein [Clostridiales bacterium]
MSIEKLEEHTYVHELEVEVAYLNENLVLKPSAYQALFAQLAENHLSFLGFGANETLKHDLAWVLISISIEVNKPITSCMKLYANTWYSQRKGPYYRRELIFYNDKKEVMFKGSTFSILMNVKDRSVYRKKELPFPLTTPYPNFCVEASPHFRDIIKFDAVETRKVLNSHIDSYGHVNNRYYGDFAYDAFNEEEKKRLSQLKRIDFYFKSEMRLNDCFVINKATDQNQIVIQGYKNTKGDVSFDIVFKFN